MIYTLTEKEIVVSCLEWDEICPQARTKEVRPPWRLLECWNTCGKTWQIWISWVRQKKFDAFVIYSVPSFQVNSVGHYKEEKTIRWRDMKMTWNGTFANDVKRRLTHCYTGMPCCQMFFSSESIHGHLLVKKQQKWEFLSATVHILQNFHSLMGHSDIIIVVKMQTILRNLTDIRGLF